MCPTCAETEQEAQGTKARFTLGQNCPNPFREKTVIRFEIPQSSDVNLTIFDLTGRAMSEMEFGYKAAGRYSIPIFTSAFRLRNRTGIFFYRLKAGKFVATKKMVVLK